jgi:uncharacterized membrane protein
MQGPALSIFDRTSTKATLVAVFAALSLATNYALIALPNIKLMDALVFIAAFLFGLRLGIGVAASTWLVYGFVNPYGQADFILLSFLIGGECFYAVAGATLSRTFVTRDLLRESRRRLRPSPVFAYSKPDLVFRFRLFRLLVRRVRLVFAYSKLGLVFALVGFQATFAYDLLTNFGSWIFKTNSLYQAFVIGIITGAPFAVLHEASNIVFFGTVAPAVIVTAKRFGLGRTEEKG